MRRTLIAAILTLAMAGAVSAGERWLHVRVLGDDSDQEIHLNLPLRFASGLLAHVDPTEWTTEIRLGGCCSGSGVDLREVLSALEESPDSEFLTLRDGEESVRVAKERGFLVVHVEGDRRGESVRARVPLAVVRAALRGPGDTLDLEAALRAIDEHGDIELVRVDGDEESVRIWVDSSENGD
jgi:hypothetical protein